MLSINHKLPLAGAIHVYPFSEIVFNLISNSFPADLSTLNVKVDLYNPVVNGVLDNGWSASTITPNTSDGYLVQLKYDNNFNSLSLLSITVNCDDTNSASFSFTWSITIGDFLGPIPTNITPPAFTDNIALGQVATIDLLDPNGGIIDKDTLNIWVRGVQIVLNGISITGVMTAAFTLLTPGLLRVALTPVALQWSDDYNYVQIQISDKATVPGHAPNKSDMVFYYRAGDKTAPIIDNFSPPEESTNLANNVQLSFDIHDQVTGVALNTIQITVNSVAAVTNGVGVAPFAASTVNPIVGGFAVVLINAATYTDSELVTVVIQADDNNANRTRDAFWAHIGTVKITTTMNSSDVDEYAHNRFGHTTYTLTKYDSSNDSFHNPDSMDHTGYAYDGLYYVSGKLLPGAAQASWFTEGSSSLRGNIAPFPASGYLIGSTNKWGIIESHGNNYNMWMLCPSDPGGHAGSVIAWSMAGNSSPGTHTIKFTNGRLFVLSDRVVIVDFTNDKAYKIDQYGLQESFLKIDDRRLNQNGHGYTVPYNLISPVTGVQFTDGDYSFRRDVNTLNSSWIISAVSNQLVAYVGHINNQLASALSVNNGSFNYATEVVNWIPDFSKVSIDSAVPHALAITHNGSTYKLLASPLSWLLKAARNVFYPALPYIELYSIGTEIIEWDSFYDDSFLYVALVTATNIKILQVKLFDFSVTTTISIPITNFGFSIVGPSLKNVSLETNLTETIDQGIIHVVGSNATQSEVVRYDIQFNSAKSMYVGTIIKSIVNIGESAV